MRIDLSTYMDNDQDGFSGNVNVSRDDVEDLTTIAQVIKDWLMAMGFTYVDDVGISKDDGTMVWGENL
jgi:hypothetical protein